MTDSDAMSAKHQGDREKMCWQCGKTFHTGMEVCPNDGARLIELTSEDQEDPLIGTLFDGRFRIYRKLGEGGMGTVYSARRLDFESDVALKLLKVDFARDDGIRKRFMYEARVISSLKHPHAVRLYDFGQTPEGNFYMVMELLNGESLADRLAYRFVTYREVFDIIPPICGVLGEAHTQDVIHRDLKPENVFLLKVEGNNEFPKLLDFGIAKHIRAETMTQSGTLWGTPAYMSPEQARGTEVGARADIYGIGIILYELISGNLPFHASTQMGFAVKHINEPPRLLSTIPGLKSVPKELDDFVLRLLAKNPEDRPESMEEVATTLLAIRERHFDAALLDSIPAEEVDPIALQGWMQGPDLAAAMATTGALDAAPAPEATAAPRVEAPPTAASTSVDEISAPDSFEERKTQALRGEDHDFGDMDTLAQPLDELHTQVLVRPKAEQQDAPVVEDEADDEKGTLKRLLTPAVALTSIIVILIMVLVITSSDKAESPVQLETTPLPEAPLDMTNVVGAAATHAAHVIIEARSLTQEARTRSKFIIVDEFEISDEDGKITRPLGDQKSGGERKSQPTQDQRLKNALEKTF